MWFPSDMAVFDFTVRITRFGGAERARPLIRSIAEIFDRLGIDHLLVDLNRDGEAAWDGVYVADPIAISGSCPLTCGLDGQIREAADRLAPEAEVRVDWYAHDPTRAATSRANREIEHTARIFGGLLRGLVPRRVRLAILAPCTYIAEFGGDGLAGSQQCSAELAFLALRGALGEAGALIGIEWRNDDVAVGAALGRLRALHAARHDVRPRSGATALLAQWAAMDELELVATEPIDPLAAETADHLNAVMFDAIRGALDIAPANLPGEEPSGGAERPAGRWESHDQQEWLGELVVSAPAARAPYLPSWD